MNIVEALHEVAQKRPDTVGLKVTRTSEDGTSAVAEKTFGEMDHETDVWATYFFEQGFSRGKTVEKLKQIGQSNRTGTRITFLPDPEIFEETREFKYELLAKRLRELAFLNPGIRIELNDERVEKSEVFRYDKGIAQYVSYLNRGKTVLHPNPITFSGASDVTDAHGKTGRICVDIAMQDAETEYPSIMERLEKDSQEQLAQQQREEQKHPHDKKNPHL